MRPEIPIVKDLHRKILKQITEHPATFNMSSFHAQQPCCTTHCWAGWIVVLAGKAGRELEDYDGSTAVAARDIIYASCSYLTKDDVCFRIDFYANEANAERKIRQFAAIEESLELSNKRKG